MPEKAKGFYTVSSVRSRMRPENPFRQLGLNELFETLLPDFVLAFAFFTSVVYAVLGKRFDHQRSAVTMSATIGFALSTGLVWWEQTRGFSMKNLGPIAVGFSAIVLALVMYKSIQHIAGSWAGVGISIGVCILIWQLLGLDVPVDNQIIQTITVVALIIGIIAFLQNTHGSAMYYPHVTTSRPEVPFGMNRQYRERHLSNQLDRRMRILRKEADVLNEHPEEAANVLLQIKRILPAEGYLTERMAQLRAKAHRVRNGHIARLEESRHVFAKLPTSAKKKASAELAARYRQLIGIDTRLERLDKAVAENEFRVKELTGRAQKYTAGYDYQKLCDCLKSAEKLQRHNCKLFKIIDRTEKKLTQIIDHITKDLAKQK